MTIRDCVDVFESYAEVCIVKSDTSKVLFEGYIIDFFEKPEILDTKVFQIKIRNDVAVFYV